ncbi:hypothetical protein [Aquicoccus sp. SU-CL01552]|uniref:hypothetical protein n=1 Tax=Aquicoccus sp. SU-CL01552 TaxID=3127656 RepID=UPI0031048C32
MHRAAGGWRRVGEVSLDVPDLSAALSELRDTALLLEPDGISCKLIIPNDQIRYLTLETGNTEGEARRVLVREALDGATPYAVDDLSFDISVEGPMTHVAAVARETLAEAEGFAVEHQFNPVSFVAIPGDQPFLGEPFFGAAENAGTADVEPDGIAVVVTGPAEIPQPETAPTETPADDPTERNIFLDDGDTPTVSEEEITGAETPDEAPAAPETAPDPEPAAPDPDDKPAPPTIGFSSRRGKEGDSAAPVLSGASRDALPERAKPAPAVSRPDPATKPAAAASPIPTPVSPPASPPMPDPSKRVISGPETAAPAALRGSVLLGSVRTRAKALLERRQSSKTNAPSPVTPPAVGQGATVIAPPPEQTPVEAERMTVFGARATQQTRGKPRHLGLILTAVLLLFLAAMAAWAALFTPEPLARLFAPKDAPGIAGRPEPAADQDADPSAEIAPPEGTNATDRDSAPAPAQPPMTSALPPPAPSDTIAALPPDATALPDAGDGETAPTHPFAPQSPALSETDSAVLEALRGDRTVPLSEEETATDEAALDPELEHEPDPDMTADLAGADTETFYAATGIWPAAPDTPEVPAIIDLDDLYVASIDRTDLSQDAVALPAARDFATDASLSGVTSPAAAGTAFNLDTRGLVTATPEGAVTPDGFTVYLGRPPVVPPATPARLPATDDAAVEAAALRQRLAGFRPRPRPTDLVEQTERTQLGGRSRAELNRFRPRARPRSAQDDATETSGGGKATPQAVASALVPRARPGDFQKIVRNSARASIGIPEKPTAAAAAPATVAPSIPSSASVARQATLKNEINLRRINLIGVYGNASNRRALIRLSSGRYKKVKVGDRIDGGKVVAIGEDQLRYQKGGRDHTLKMPSS